MAEINVSSLTFAYEGSFDNIFENVSFALDTDWKLGFVGRNGKGKTTFLRLLMGDCEYSGSIRTNTRFDYFPYPVTEKDLEKTADEMMEHWKPDVESWRVLCELPALSLETELLYRPLKTLSHGERTKVMLAVLFSGEGDFLLIDEPTNHLDAKARETVKKYLATKKGYILVSHDRDLLDACTDHILVLNRSTIEVQAGNFSSWWENKEKADNFALAENEKHKKEIRKLTAAADRAARWADKNEATKIGFDPKKEPDRNISTRSYIGAKTKKMQSRVKAVEGRIEREIEEKEGLLQDIERVQDLKLNPLTFHKNRLIEARDFSLRYPDSTDWVVQNLSFELNQGERIFLRGANGCGKSSMIRAILGKLNPAEYRKTPVDREIHSCEPDFAPNDSSRPVNPASKESSVTSNLVLNNGISETDRILAPDGTSLLTAGILNVPKGMIVSYVNQDTSHLSGSLKEYAEQQNLNYSLLLTLLRKLDLTRLQFEKDMSDFSEGQKKKVLIAASLITPAHLYIWDEPLNYIDIFSRMQIEKLIEEYHPSMLLVEHDVRFTEKLASRVVEL